jgi:hypothetical protein
MKVLFKVLMGIAVISGYNLQAASASVEVEHAMTQQTYLDISESGTTPLVFTATTGGGAAVALTTTLATTQAWGDRQTGTSEVAEIEIALATNDNDGFTLAFVSTEDGNLLNSDNASGYCDGVIGNTATKDIECITYEIGCDTITHDETNGQTGIVTYFSNEATPSASEFVKLEDSSQNLYVAAASSTTGGNQAGAMYRGNVAHLKTGNLELMCDLQFAANETIAEVASNDSGVYTDTITVTLTEH